MHYMLLTYGAPDQGPAPDSPEGQREFSEWFGYHQSVLDSGAFVAGEPLEPIASATTLRVHNGERVVTDGPFAETREVLGGFYVVDVPDLDAALDWAARMPHLAHGSVEVRPVTQIPAPG